MTRRTQRWQKWVKLPLAAAVAAGISAQASALQFYLGSMEGSFDTSLSAGVGIRTQSPDQKYIGQGNLGPQYAYSNIGASSGNYDNGDLNFKAGDIYSELVKGTSELYLNKSVNGQYLSRVGGFVRGRYWYDFKLKQNDFAVNSVGEQHKLNHEALNRASGAELLDAYVYSDWNLGDVPVSVRYGRQVLSWGESTFIQNGINIINPVDVSAIRAPGAELKEALLPVEMFYMSAGVTDNITLEGFVQTKWAPTRIDDCGTFFSNNDFVGNGCGPVLVYGELSDKTNLDNGYIVPRVGDKRPGSNDQFGLAMRWYLPDLNESELGFYFVHYNSRLPYVSGIVNDPANGKVFPSYFVEYPTNIHLYGVSLNTSLPGGWSLGAEYSFRDNLPLQWNAFELIYGGLQLPYSQLYQQQVANGVNPATLAGKEVQGYDRYKVSQAQFTLIKFFDQVMGASRLSVVTEVGADYVHGLPSTNVARYGRSGIYGIGSFNYQTATGTISCTTPANTTGNLPTNINTSNCTNDGFTTRFSWGYRMRFVLDYPDVIQGVNLHPQLAWSQDVQGNSPEPGANFIDGRKSVGLSLKAVYLNKYTADIAYTNYFGGRYTTMNDRDNVMMSVSYSF
ncbi:DUF1302 domain-containing protein [Mangrovitalea sediminis]|uniref:DUF1302 domain-containing protein n=1 Tax=Mangrovitalea sediminis TaxID=1982043 RepID=UPI000BE5C40D|nr:DUF1302 domain-containing protein [Mangrovitalea sediminis]